MKGGRTKNAVRNIGWGVVEKIIALLLPFFTRTVLIKTLGSEYLGLNSLFTSILQVLSITELGFGSAIVFSMYEPVARDDKALICALLKVYKKVYHVVGSVILIAGLCVLPFINHFISGDIPPGINIYVLYLIYLFNTVVSYFLFAYKTALFSAYQRNDLASKRTTFVSLTGNILMIVSLLIFRNYYVYVIFVPLSTIVTNIINAVLANKMFPDIKCMGTISNKMKSDMKKRIIGLISYKIYSVILSSVDTIVISAFLGLKILAIYNNYYYVQTAIIGFLSIIMASITAGIGNKMVTNSREDNYLDFQKVTFINAWISSWCSVCLVCLYQHFMTWWVGEDLTFSIHTMILMVVYFFFPRVSTVTFTYREAAGLWWEDRFRPIIATMVNLALNIYLVKKIGVDGVIISTIVCTIFINIPWGSYVLFKNYFRIKPWKYYLKLICYTLATICVALVSWLICSLLPNSGFAALLFKGVICAVIPNIMFLIIYCRTKEYKEAKEIFFGIFSKFVNKSQRS